MKPFFSLILMVMAGTDFVVNAESLSDFEILNGMKQEMRRSQTSGNTAFSRYASGFTWTIIHDPSDKLMEQVLMPVEEIVKILGKNAEEQQVFLKAGGIKNFRNRLRANLKSGDPGTEALSALYLALIKDYESVQDIAALLDIDRSTPPPAKHKNLVNIHRAAAATALALMQEAGPYEGKIAAMLDSKAANDLYGAGNAIMIMGWKQYLPKTAKWLGMRDCSKDEKFNREEAGQEEQRFLTAMRLAAHFKAKEYAPELLAELMPREFKDKTGNTLYLRKHPLIEPKEMIVCLAVMDARETAKELARFYPMIGKYDSFSRGAVISALAVFRAKDQRNIVLTELARKDITTMNCCLVTLAMLGDDTDVPMIVEYLEDKNGVVGASAALMYLGRKEYYGRINEKMSDYLKRNFPGRDSQDMTGVWRYQFGMSGADIPAFDVAARKIETVWRSLRTGDDDQTHQKSSAQAVAECREAAGKTADLPFDRRIELIGNQCFPKWNRKEQFEFLTQVFPLCDAGSTSALMKIALENGLMESWEGYADMLNPPFLQRLLDSIHIYRIPLDWKVEAVSGKDKMFALIFTDLRTGEQQVFHTRSSIFQETNGSFSGADYVWNFSDAGVYTFRHTNRGWTFLCGPTPARKEIRPPLPGPFKLILKNHVLRPAAQKAYSGGYELLLTFEVQDRDVSLLPARDIKISFYPKIQALPKVCADEFGPPLPMCPVVEKSVIHASPGRPFILTFLLSVPPAWQKYELECKLYLQERDGNPEKLFCFRVPEMKREEKSK